MDTAGVYQIINRIDGKRYVGSSKDLHNRKSQHFSSLRRGTHHNPGLQSVVHKYGVDALEFRVIGICAEQNRVRLERECINHLKPEYNVYTKVKRLPPPKGSKAERIAAVREKAKAAWRRSGITGLGGL